MAITETTTMPDPQYEIDPVGPSEIAARLNVPVGTVQGWIHRKLLPPTRWRVGRGPVWEWSDIEAWAITTGRMATRTPVPGAQCPEMPYLVGVGEIADHLDISRSALRLRIQEGRMPPPKWRVSARDVWLWDDVKGLPTNRNRHNTSR